MATKRKKEYKSYAFGTPEHKQHSCTRKKRFVSKEEANDSAKSFRKKYGSKMMGYCCYYCGHWHIGHNRSKKLRKKHKSDIIVSK